MTMSTGHARQARRAFWSSARWRGRMSWCPDSFEGLVALGRAARARTDATIIGVTGSAGKTGTKEALFHAFDRLSFGAAHRSLKSYNNHVGVPLSPRPHARADALRHFRDGHEP